MKWSLMSWCQLLLLLNGNNLYSSNKVLIAVGGRSYVLRIVDDSFLVEWTREVLSVTSSHISNYSGTDASS